MSKFKPYKIGQLFLLPNSLHDFVEDGHLAKIVDEVVEELDTKEIEEKYDELGQKSYHPKILLKLLFYGYATGIRSGRKIATCCENDTAFMYLAQMYRPDFRTINDFRKNNLDIIKKFFVDIVRLCKELGMVKIGTVSIDSVKIRANASAKRTKNKEGYERWLKNVEEQIKKILEEANRIDEEEDRKYGTNKRGDEIPKKLKNKKKLKEKIKEIAKKLKDEKEKINLTDKDAKFIKERNGVTKPNYNCHISTTEEQIIMSADVTNIASDTEHLLPMVDQTEENTNEKIEKVNADSGYASLDNYEELDKREVDTHMPDRNFIMEKEGKFEKEKKKFHKGNFKYDKEEDCYTCPADKKLNFFKEVNGRRVGVKVRLYKNEECCNCQFKDKCCKNLKVRIIKRDKREDIIDKVREKLKTEEGKKIYLKRMYSVEPIFGHLKCNLKFINFLLRGIEKVKGEFKLMCIGYNIMKIFKFKQQFQLIT
jgi:transposase